jgi:hypothetical protein
VAGLRCEPAGQRRGQNAARPGGTRRASGRSRQRTTPPVRGGRQDRPAGSRSGPCGCTDPCPHGHPAGVQPVADGAGRHTDQPADLRGGQPQLHVRVSRQLVQLAGLGVPAGSGPAGATRLDRYPGLPADPLPWLSPVIWAIRDVDSNWQAGIQVSDPLGQRRIRHVWRTAATVLPEPPCGQQPAVQGSPIAHQPPLVCRTVGGISAASASPSAVVLRVSVRCP